MEAIAGKRAGLTWAVHLSVLALVLLWLFPTVGLFVSSFRTADQIATSGWWKALFPSEQNLTLRTAPPEAQVQQGDSLATTNEGAEQGGKDEPGFEHPLPPMHCLPSGWRISVLWVYRASVRRALGRFFPGGVVWEQGSLQDGVPLRRGYGPVGDN